MNGTPPTLPVSAIIPTRNRPTIVARLLQSLRAQGALPAEIIFVDASPDDATKKEVEAFATEVQDQGCRLVWRAAVKAGAAIQRNEGVEYATQPIVAFFDDDILFEPFCMERLFGAMQSDPKLGGVNAMIVNQRYQTPGTVSRTMFRILAGQHEKSYGGRLLGPAINLLPEDSDERPEIAPVEWLNLGATLYRREALPKPVFHSHFTGYSMMEDVTLSVYVGRTWKLANVRTARIFHDSQPGEHKSNVTAVARMETVNRHYVMTRVLQRRRPRDYGKFILWEVFQLIVCAIQQRVGRNFWLTLKGKFLALSDIFSKTEKGPA